MKTVALLQTRKYTPEEYLVMEEAEYKSEFWSGYIIPLHGGKPPSNNFCRAKITVGFINRLSESKIRWSLNQSKRK